MSRQDRDQVVIEDENPELVEEPQSTAVYSFDHVVVGLQVGKRKCDEHIIAAVEKQTKLKAVARSVRKMHRAISSTQTSCKPPRLIHSYPL